MRLEGKQEVKEMYHEKVRSCTVITPLGYSHVVHCIGDGLPELWKNHDHLLLQSIQSSRKLQHL